MSIPLLLEQLEGNPAWQLLKSRIERELEVQRSSLETARPDIKKPEIQRMVGQIIGLKRVLAEPNMMLREWRRAVDIENQKVRAQQTNADEDD